MNSSEKGRSMIEMLGVLAIIGVLSVGGIAGYSKAMMKYRTNKTIEQISLISGNIRSFFGPQKSYIDLDYHYSSSRDVLIKKAKLVPDEMITEIVGSDSSRLEIVSAFGGGLSISSDSSGKAFNIIMSSIPQEACIEIATQTWPNEVLAVWIASDYSSQWRQLNEFMYNTCQTGSLSKSAGAYQACRSKGDLPIDIDKATEACSCTSNICDINFAFK